MTVGLEFPAVDSLSNTLQNPCNVTTPILFQKALSLGPYFRETLPWRKEQLLAVHNEQRPRMRPTAAFQRRRQLTVELQRLRPLLKQYVLHEHTVVMADKGYGPTLLPNAVYDKLVLEAVDQFAAYSSLSYADAVHFCPQQKFGRLYGIPKLHKSPIKMRPIVNMRGFELSHLDIELTTTWNSIRKRMQSIHRGMIPGLHMAGKAVKRICNEQQQGQREDTLCVGDVESLYTNLEHQLITRVATILFKRFMSMDRNGLRSFIETLTMFLQRLVVVLRLRTETPRYFKQVKGIPMGAKCSPAMADTVLAYVEVITTSIPPSWLYFTTNVLATTADIQLLSSYIRPQPIQFIRYLDDVFGPTKALEQLQTSLKLAGLNLKIESTQSENLQYLDMFVRNGVVHQLPKPTNAFYHALSCVAPHHVKGILAGILYQALRNGAQNWTETLGWAVYKLYLKGHSLQYVFKVLGRLLRNVKSYQGGDWDTTNFIWHRLNPRVKTALDQLQLLQFSFAAAGSLKKSNVRRVNCYSYSSRRLLLFSSFSFSNVEQSRSNKQQLYKLPHGYSLVASTDWNRREMLIDITPNQIYQEFLRCRRTRASVCHS